MDGVTTYEYVYVYGDGGGTNGTDGRDGVSGTNGASGTSGANGNSGVNGTNGADGVASSISNIVMNEKGEFVFMMTDGRTITTAVDTTMIKDQAVPAAAAPEASSPRGLGLLWFIAVLSLCWNIVMTVIYLRDKKLLDAKAAKK